MTGRVCPVHGEYSETGVCRWCEPQTEYDWTRGPEVDTPEKLARIANLDEDPPVSSAIADEMNRLWLERPSETLRAWMRPLFSTRQRYRTQEGIASHNAFWEAKLDSQHAALRWGRVARRWNWKHREPRWINEEWRAYVWRCWLEQMALRREGNLIAAGIPKEWP